ncbi:hypothetical protein [Mesonia maritima]|uniref:Uncharacterized protein n=1 Tax=Mesonia maritima TaxID=1793873 RepID=A0ABU1KCQ8_9FLAO|nr:hypothetical protein [Mesonia maritima]MDR6302252.1 hypothetical protein [Mesonia maritima]
MKSFVSKKMDKFSRNSLIGGVVATVITSTGMILMGHVSGLEAKDLIISSLPRLNTFFNTVVLASATILTLLLTITNISHGSKSTLKKTYYIRILKIAKLDATVFIVSVITFLLMNNPLTEAESINTSYYSYLYYVWSSISSIVCGAIVAVIIMLYYTITTLISIVGLNKEDHPLLHNEEPEEA